MSRGEMEREGPLLRRSGGVPVGSGSVTRGRSTKGLTAASVLAALALAVVVAPTAVGAGNACG
jgi:hypothetical protein